MILPLTKYDMHLISLTNIENGAILTHYFALITGRIRNN